MTGVPFLLAEMKTNTKVRELVQKIRGREDTRPRSSSEGVLDALHGELARLLLTWDGEGRPRFSRVDVTIASRTLAPESLS